MQQLIPKQRTPPNPTRSDHTSALHLNITLVLQHHVRDDTLPKSKQGIVLGALGVEGRSAVARDALAVLRPVGEGVAHRAVAVEGEQEDLLGRRGRSLAWEVVRIGFEGCVLKGGKLVLGNRGIGKDWGKGTEMHGRLVGRVESQLVDDEGGDFGAEGGQGREGGD